MKVIAKDAIIRHLDMRVEEVKGFMKIAKKENAEENIAFTTGMYVALCQLKRDILIAAGEADDNA